MKKIIFFALLLALTSAAFSQQIDSAKILAKPDYLGKSKRQKTGAWILLGGGSVFVATGLLLIYAAPDAATVLADIGIISMLGSIPLFIASSSNKRKAAKVSTSIKFEEGSLVQSSALSKIQFPAIAVKINL